MLHCSTHKSANRQDSSKPSIIWGRGKEIDLSALRSGVGDGDSNWEVLARNIHHRRVDGTDSTLDRKELSAIRSLRRGLDGQHWEKGKADDVDVWAGVRDDELADLFMGKSGRILRV